jgi:glycosyltransferase involved in cell wall biosynthesis
MHILIATDTWHPQINGVLRSLLATARAVETLGAKVTFLNYEGFCTVPLPNYREIRLAVPRPAEISERIEEARPDAIHIATEGTIGHLVRRHCLATGRPFTTSFHTRLPDYLSARMPFPETWAWRWLRRFHAPSSAVLAATSPLAAELVERGFVNVRVSPLGVDTELFRPHPGADLGLPRPVFLSVGRLAVEKNIDAFLALDLPGSKIVVGDGPARADLAARYPGIKFLGMRQGEELAAIYAAADAFVFPSRTDTFGLVLLEALASGVPVAAYPVTGPRDVIGHAPVGALDADLRAACLRALTLSRTACREFALGMSWQESAKAFLGHIESAPLRGATVVAA